MVYRNLDKMSAEERTEIIRQAEKYLQNVENCKTTIPTKSYLPITTFLKASNPLISIFKK